MATDILKACPASSSMLGNQNHSLRGLHQQAEARIRIHGINKGCCSGSKELHNFSSSRSFRPSGGFVLSVEPFLEGRRRGASSSMVDAIRIRNAGAAAAQVFTAFFKLGMAKKQNPAARFKVQTAHTKSSNLSKTSLFLSREIVVGVAATAGPGQTFPSQNGGGEKALPMKPDPAVEPGEVVQAQLKALRERDLATVYEFASPANKNHTGPLPRFTQMLEGRAYNLMIGHIHAEILSSMTVSTNRFQQRIVLTGANGKNATFSWALSKQEEGPYEGCWMTDTVRRDD